MNYSTTLDEAPYLKARKRLQRLPNFGDDLHCNVGYWPDTEDAQCVVLKLLKSHWSNDSLQAIRNTSGIFFSVWSDRVKIDRLHFNLHALKLRELKAFKLESRKCAATFRAAFVSKSVDWPNVRVDYGPQTWMQGYLDVSADDIEDGILKLAERFLPWADWIDEALLRSKKKSGDAAGVRRV